MKQAGNIQLPGVSSTLTLKRTGTSGQFFRPHYFPKSFQKVQVLVLSNIRLADSGLSGLLRASNESGKTRPTKRTGLISNTPQPKADTHPGGERINIVDNSLSATRRSLVRPVDK